jgi:hypothetical protein
MAKAQRNKEASRILAVAQAVHVAAAACMSDRGGTAFSDFQQRIMDVMQD